MNKADNLFRFCQYANISINKYKMNTSDQSFRSWISNKSQIINDSILPSRIHLDFES